jgi:hypothetical protein
LETSRKIVQSGYKLFPFEPIRKPEVAAMSSVSAAGSISSSNLSALLQGLSSVGGGVLSSPQVAAALANAPPQDVAQLSTAAVQLQAMGELFGLTDGTSGSSDSSSNYSSDMSSILSQVDASAAASQAPGSAPASGQALSTQLAAYQADMQGAMESALLSGSTVSAFG